MEDRGFGVADGENQSRFLRPGLELDGKPQALAGLEAYLSIDG